jgi:hypothetical protein
MVFSVNGRAIYETVPEWESPTLPGYHTLEAVSNGCFMAIVEGALYAAFTSTLRAALGALALAPLGINLTIDSATGLKSDYPSVLPSAASSTAGADAAGQGVDSIMNDIQGALEAAAAASTTHMDVDASWPPVVNVSLIVGTVSPGFGVTPPSFKECCGWSTHPHDDTAASVGVTSFAAGPLYTVAGAETFLTEEDLGTLDTYSADKRIVEDEVVQQEDADLLVPLLIPPLPVSDLSPSDTRSRSRDAAGPSSPAVGAPPGSGSLLVLNTSSQVLEPNKSNELYSPHSPVTHCAQSTVTDNSVLRVHSPSYCTVVSPATVECCQDMSQWGVASPTLSTVDGMGSSVLPPCIADNGEERAVHWWTLTQDLFGRGYFGRAPPPPRWHCPLSGE